jgi:hypothetical protein
MLSNLLPNDDLRRMPSVPDPSCDAEGTGRAGVEVDKTFCCSFSGTESSDPKEEALPRSYASHDVGVDLPRWLMAYVRR